MIFVEGYNWRGNTVLFELLYILCQINLFISKNLEVEA